MARKSRYHCPGGFYHVIMRGNNGQKIFFSDEDRSRLCLFIQEICERFDCLVHGFCFMSNHIHVILQVFEKHISDAVQNLAFRYTRYINSKYKRVGHLFQGRFKSYLVEDGDYLQEVLRYVHLNPVRANMVKAPEDYRWSGHRVYLGTATLLWLTQSWILAKFHNVEVSARERYAQFINKTYASEIPSHHFKHGSHHGAFFGSDSFVNRILAEHNEILENSFEYSLNEILEAVCDVLDMSLTKIKLSGKERNATRARALAAYFVNKHSQQTLKELAEILERDVSSLSKLAKDIETKCQTDQSIASQIAEIFSILRGLGEGGLDCDL